MKYCILRDILCCCARALHFAMCNQCHFSHFVHYSNSEPAAALYSDGVDPLTVSSNCVRINCICIIHRCINTTNTQDAPGSYSSIMGET
jgi:hypothetical protein